MDKKVTELFEWIRANAGYIHEGLIVGNISSNERSLFTKTEITKGTIVVRIPTRLSIIASDNQEPHQRIKQTIMKLFAEMRNKGSLFKAYLDTLPGSTDIEHLPIMKIQPGTKLFDVMRALNNDFAERISAMVALINEIYDEISDGYPGLPLDIYKKAAALYFSRSWKEFGLIPVIDLLQHSNTSQNLIIKTSDKRIVNEESICLVATETIPANSEVTINYGASTSLTDFYAYYGFIFETNRIPVYLNKNLSEDTPINKFINHELARCKITSLCITDTEIPDNFFQALRILHLEESDIKTEPVLSQYIKFIAGTQERKKSLLMFDTEGSDINYSSAISITNEFKVYKSLMKLLKAGCRKAPDNILESESTITMLKKIKSIELCIYNHCYDYLKQQWLKLIDNDTN